MLPPQTLWSGLRGPPQRLRATLLSISDEIITDSLVHCREIVYCLVWSQEHIISLSFSPKASF